jgi:uncharacterized protein (TIGR02284 family)
MEQTHAVSVLNDVLQTLRDGEEGFRTAAGAVKDTHVKDIFDQYARQRAEMARELEEEIGKLGGTAGTSGSVSDSLHRGWMNLKGSIGALDDKAIVSEAERGEDAAQSAYATALKADLPAGVRRLLEDQADIVRLAHNEVRALEKRGSNPR